MSIGSVSRGKRRVVVEFPPALADEIASAAKARSTSYRKVTASDVIREAVARFLLPVDATNNSHDATKSSDGFAAPGEINGRG